MTNIDEIVGKIVNESHYEITHHRMTVLKDALYIIDVIKKGNPPKQPEMFDIHRKDGSFAYHHIIEYNLPRYKETDGF